MKKQANMGRLPDQMNANISMVNGLRQQHESLSLQLRTEQDRLSMVEGQLEQMKQGAGAGGDDVDRRRGDPGSAGADQRAAASAARSTGRTATPTSTPTSSRRRRSWRWRSASSPRRASRARRNSDDCCGRPGYRQKISERDAIRLRIATLQRQIAQALSQIGSYQARVEAAPLVEQELSSLRAGRRARAQALQGPDLAASEGAARGGRRPASRAASASSCSTRRRCRHGRPAPTCSD